MAPSNKQADAVKNMLQSRFSESQSDAEEPLLPANAGDPAKEGGKDDKRRGSIARRGSVIGSESQAERVIGCLVRIHVGGPLTITPREDAEGNRTVIPIAYTKDRRASCKVTSSPEKGPAKGADPVEDSGTSPDKTGRRESVTVSLRGKDTANSVLSLLQNMYGGGADSDLSNAKDQASRVKGLLQNMFNDEDIAVKKQQAKQLAKDTDGQSSQNVMKLLRRQSAEVSPPFGPGSNQVTESRSNQALSSELDDTKARLKQQQQECQRLETVKAQVLSELETVKAQVKLKNDEIDRLVQAQKRSQLSSGGLNMTGLGAQKESEIRALQASLQEAQTRALTAEADRDAVLRRNQIGSKSGGETQELQRMRDENESLLAQVAALNKENTQLLREAKESRDKLRSSEARASTKQGEIAAIKVENACAQAKLQEIEKQRSGLPDAGWKRPAFGSPPRSQASSPDKDKAFSFDSAPAEIVAPRSASRPRTGYEALGLEELRQLNDALLEIKRENTALLKRLNGGVGSPARSGSPLRYAPPRDPKNPDGADGVAWPWQSPARRILAFRPKPDGADGP